METRPQRQGLVQGCLGFIETAGLGEGKAEIAGGFRHGGIKPLRLGCRGCRLAGLSGGQQQRGEIGMEGGMGGRQPDRMLQMPHSSAGWPAW